MTRLHNTGNSSQISESGRYDLLGRIGRSNSFEEPNRGRSTTVPSGPLQDRHNTTQHNIRHRSRRRRKPSYNLHLNRDLYLAEWQARPVRFGSVRFGPITWRKAGPLRLSVRTKRKVRRPAMSSGEERTTQRRGAVVRLEGATPKRKANSGARVGHCAGMVLSQAEAARQVKKEEHFVEVEGRNGRQRARTVSTNTGEGSGDSSLARAVVEGALKARKVFETESRVVCGCYPSRISYHFYRTGKARCPIPWHGDANLSE